jgi:hypothetical protein
MRARKMLTLVLLLPALLLPVPLAAAVLGPPVAAAPRLRFSCIGSSAQLCVVGLGQTLELRVDFQQNITTRRATTDDGQPQLVLPPPGVPAGLKVWAFVNGTQWGAPVTPPHTQLLLPMPRVGTATVQLALLPRAAFPSPSNLPIRSPGGFPVGTPLSEASPWDGVRSAQLQVVVTPRVVSPPVARWRDDPLVLIEWESEFSAHYNTWVSREATPLCGLYSSYNTDVHRQHALWLVEAGVDAVLMDWVDTLFHAHPHFDSNAAGAEDMDASVATAATWAQMRADGLPTPLAVPLLGLDNGNPGTVSRKFLCVITMYVCVVVTVSHAGPAVRGWQRRCCSSRLSGRGAHSVTATHS